MVRESLKVDNLVLRFPLIRLLPLEIRNDITHDPQCDLECILLLRFLGLLIFLQHDTFFLENMDLLLLADDGLDVPLVDFVVADMVVVYGLLFEKVVLFLQ